LPTCASTRRFRNLDERGAEEWTEKERACGAELKLQLASSLSEEVPIKLAGLRRDSVIRNRNASSTK
jgi:hypothetical protein